MRWDDERYVATFTGESCGPLWRMCQPRLVETQPFLAALNAGRRWVLAGDVIVSVNGEAMTGHDVLLTALQLNGGVLNLEVVYEGSNEIQLVRVVAQRVRVSSF